MDQQKETYRPPGKRKESQPLSSAKPKLASYAEVVKRLAIPNKKNTNFIEQSVESLSQLNYDEELKLKNQALQGFWTLNKLPGQPEKIQPSPKARAYRTTSNRKVAQKKSRFYLLFNYEQVTPQKHFYRASRLEPQEHSTIYRFLQEKINQGSYKLLSSHLSNITIRGSYQEFSVIFTVLKFDGQIVRKVKLLCDHLKKLEVNIISAFVYLNPSPTSHSLENWRPSNRISFKKIFGPEKLFIKFNNCKYLFYPHSFSHANQSIMPMRQEIAKNLLSPKDGKFLLDLYCGYGFFTHHLSKYYRKLIGLDANMMSIKAAEENRRFFIDKRQSKFIAKGIKPAVLERVLAAEKELPEDIIFDPPRQGTEAGVIKLLAAAGPEKVLYIFNGMEDIRPRLGEWLTHGYRFTKVVPLDSFPGTLNLETFVLLEPR